VASHGALGGECALVQFCLFTQANHHTTEGGRLRPQIWGLAFSCGRARLHALQHGPPRVAETTRDHADYGSVQEESVVAPDQDHANNHRDKSDHIDCHNHYQSDSDYTLRCFSRHCDGLIEWLSLRLFQIFQKFSQRLFNDTTEDKYHRADG